MQVGQLQKNYQGEIKYAYPLVFIPKLLQIFLFTDSFFLVLL